MMHMTKIAIPFELVPGNDVPIIKFHLDDKPRYAIVDTGAESTLFDSSVRHLLKLVKTEQISIVGVSDESEQAMIDTVEGKIWMINNDRHLNILNVRGYIHDLSHISNHFLGEDNDKIISAILGSDMLNEFNAKIDFIKHEVLFML